MYIKKKIVFVLGGMVGGGAERVAAYLMNYLVGKNYQVELISRRGAEYDAFILDNEIKRTNLGGEGPSKNKIIAFVKNVFYIWKLRKAIKNSETDIIISFLTKTNIHSILATAWLNVKLIISERNDTIRQNHPTPWPFFRKYLYNYADWVTANSRVGLSGMKNYVDSKKLKMIPNPVFIPLEKARTDQSKIIINVGRLVPVKRQDLIIRAFSLLSMETRRHWSLEILGDGEEYDSLKSLAKKLSVERFVKLHGFVKNTESYYIDSAIFILASEFEGTPNALLEAMSYGLPCIVSDSLNGALDLIEHKKNGLIFKSGSVSDLKLKIEELMNNAEDRVHYGKMAQEKIKVFAVDKIMPKWIELIE